MVTAATVMCAATATTKRIAQQNTCFVRRLSSSKTSLSAVRSSSSLHSHILNQQQQSRRTFSTTINILSPFHCFNSVVPPTTTAATTRATTKNLSVFGTTQRRSFATKKQKRNNISGKGSQNEIVDRERHKNLCKHEVIVRLPCLFMGDEDETTGGTNRGLGRIQRWRYKEGDMLKYDDVLCDIETADFIYRVQIEDEEPTMLYKILVPAVSPEYDEWIPENEPICILLQQTPSAEVESDVTQKEEEDAAAMTLEKFIREKQTTMNVHDGTNIYDGTKLRLDEDEEEVEEENEKFDDGLDDEEYDRDREEKLNILVKDPENDDVKQGEKEGKKGSWWE